jgi:hypothetical protein
MTLVLVGLVRVERTAERFHPRGRCERGTTVKRKSRLIAGSCVGIIKLVGPCRLQNRLIGFFPRVLVLAKIEVGRVASV